MGSVSKPINSFSNFENPESFKKVPGQKDKAHNFVPDKMRDFSPDENLNINNVPANSPAVYAYDSFGHNKQTRSAYKPKLSTDELIKRTENLRAKQ